MRAHAWPWAIRFRCSSHRPLLGSPRKSFAVPPSLHHDSEQSISVVVAADESYCIPLAVTVASMLESLAADARVDVFVLDNGITQASKERLQQSWQDGRATIRWISAGLRPCVRGRAVSGTAVALRLADADPSPGDRDSPRRTHLVPTACGKGSWRVPRSPRTAVRPGWPEMEKSSPGR